MNQTQKGFATLGTLIAAALFLAAACIDSTTSIAGKAAEIGGVIRTRQTQLPGEQAIFERRLEDEAAQ
jgi:hypothetical protein